MDISTSDRLNQLPPYLFKEIDRKKEALKAKGVDIINLGVGDPDMPTPSHIVAALQEAAARQANHQYPSYSGMAGFNVAVSDWYQKRFNVSPDPDTQVITLIGSKEGIAHIPLAFINPGDLALAPNPAYPVYQVAVGFAGGQVQLFDLKEENGFLPDLSAIDEQTAKKAKLMFLNYPNNPTSATADLGFFEEIVAFAKKYEIIVCHDAAYSEIYFNGNPPKSFMQAKGAMDVGVEFNSLSKTYNMTGWRLGFAVGRSEIIQGLAQVKSNVDSGQFQAVQIAGIQALEGSQDCVEQIRATYQERRDVLVKGLSQLGLSFLPLQATFYLWLKAPKGYTSASFADHLLTQCGVVVTPGNGFGSAGEGYVRMSLTIEKERLNQAMERLRDTGF